MKYVVSEWSPGCAGEIVASVESIHEAVEVARACYQAQITAPAWGGGYVTTWAEGGASAKYFPGHDAWGFGGGDSPGRRRSGGEAGRLREVS